MLQLGCGLAPIEGAVNHDRDKHSPHVDVSHDLNVFPWPFDDGSFDKIISLDVFEHLSVSVDLWLNECHRVLSENGQLLVRVPHYRHENAYTDPTHRQFSTTQTFDYWDASKLLHQKYGVFYYAAAGRWWTVKDAKTDGVDIQFILWKKPSHH
jgi:predicted SAM-dependent methyltransferase